MFSSAKFFSLIIHKSASLWWHARRNTKQSDQLCIHFWPLCVLQHEIHLFIVSPNEKKILQSKNVSNTELNSSLRATEWYAYCMDYWYFTPRYGFPKSNCTVPTFFNKIQWRGWHHAVSFNYHVHTTPHPVLNFLGIYIWVLCNDILAFFGA